MNTAYIYRLTNKEGLIYIGSHLIRKGKTLYTDNYAGSSKDPRINNQITCKEILSYIKSQDRILLYEYIQLLEHHLILDLDAINTKQYANATSMGVIGLNYKRLGGILSNIKSPKSKEKRSEIGKKGAKAVAYLRTSEWHRKGQKVSAKSRRQGWSEEIYNSVIEAHKKYPNKKAHALWSYLKKPTKTYSSIFYMLKNIDKGLCWKDIA